MRTVGGERCSDDQASARTAHNRRHWHRNWIGAPSPAPKASVTEWYASPALPWPIT